MRVQLSRPDITEHEVSAVTAVLRSGRLSMGPQVEAFEGRRAALAGRRHGVAVSSGTAGLHAALVALGIGPGDEVVTTPFSFVASANCILFTGASVVFADVEPVSLNLDPQRVAERLTPRTRAILGVDVFGHPCDLRAMPALADEPRLAFVEDS